MNFQKTIDYYNENAQRFAAGTAFVPFEDMQNRFADKLPKAAFILDFGCGSGRDAKYFLQKGFQVEAIDASKELCRIASEHAKIPVRQMLFQDLNDTCRYDGIWACASILHLPKQELCMVLDKMVRALKSHGILYISFKYGNFEGERSGRYFTDMTEASFGLLIEGFVNLEIEEQWVTSDVRPGRGDEKWLNAILRKKK